MTDQPTAPAHEPTDELPKNALVSHNKPTAEEAEAHHRMVYTADHDYIYLTHHYGRDDWHGTGTPYRTLAAAVLGASNHYDDYGPWIDASEVDRHHTTPDTLWYPAYYEGEPMTARDYADGEHPYIEKAKIIS